jgi:hypothetical protein
MMRRFWILRKLTDINAVRETSESKKLSNPEVLFNVGVEKITPEGINIVNKDGGKRILDYDTFIVSRERVADDSLWEELRSTKAEIHKIGDCSQVGDIRKAIHSANEVARKIWPGFKTLTCY